MKLEDNVSNLPNTPGVYQFFDAKEEIIYVGKAARLKVRVSQYFAYPIKDSREKVAGMMREVSDVRVIETGSEIEALFLESELIKRYKPKYNADWKDERNYLYVRINFVFDFPNVKFVRRPLPDKATYIGPFIDTGALKRSMRYLRKIFPYSVHKPNTKSRRACLDFDIGLCPGPEVGAITSSEYKRSLKKLIAILEGRRKKVITELSRDMKAASKSKDFEKAALERDRINALEGLGRRIVFGREEKFGIMSDEGLIGLKKVLVLKTELKRIEAYDISNISGADAVGSMIVFEEGIPRRDEYKRFKIKWVKGINDFMMLREVVRRRFAKSGWKTPDLILVDGGKGQLSAVAAELKRQGIDIPAIGLAKREEEIITIDKTIKLAHTNPALKLLQRIRDEAHRFAVTYHSGLRLKSQKASSLDKITGIGSETKKKLLLHYGSASAIFDASLEELTRIIGSSKAKIIKDYGEKKVRH